MCVCAARASLEWGVCVCAARAHAQHTFLLWSRYQWFNMKIANACGINKFELTDEEGLLKI